jgi:hypothetical protein
VAVLEVLLAVVVGLVSGGGVVCVEWEKALHIDAEEEEEEEEEEEDEEEEEVRRATPPALTRDARDSMKGTGGV